MEDLFHINQLLHELGLIDVAWYSVKHQSVDVRLELSLQYLCFNLCPPEFDSQVIRHQQSLARVVDEFLPKRSSKIERTKHVATRTMEESRNTSQDFALRSFSTAGSAHEKISYIASHKSGGQRIGRASYRVRLQITLRGVRATSIPLSHGETPGFIRTLIIRCFCFSRIL